MCPFYHGSKEQEERDLEWFTEHASDAHRMQWGINQVLYRGKSAYQTVEIFESAEWDVVGFRWRDANYHGRRVYLS